MKPETLAKKQAVERARQAHFRALESLRAPGCQLSGIQIWRKLNRLERTVGACTLAYCNGERVRASWPHLRGSLFEFDSNNATNAPYVESMTADGIRQAFGHVPAGFFVNWDARGSALKLDNEKTTLPEGLWRDLGGFGILAAQIN